MVQTGDGVSTDELERAISAGVDDALEADLPNGIAVECPEVPEHKVAACLNANGVREAGRDPVGMEIDLQAALSKGMAQVGYDDARVDVTQVPA